MYIRTHIGMLQECKVAPHAPSADDKLSGRSAVENPPMRCHQGIVIVAPLTPTFS